MIRRLPVVCLFIALFSLVIGRLRFPTRYRSQVFVAEDGQIFTVFRHMRRTVVGSYGHDVPVIFVVRFRFARFTDRLNRVLSLMPITLIAGFPGFHEKIWMVNGTTGEWQGLYEWESERAAEEYKRSFVLRTMMRRTVTGSVSFRTVSGTSITDYLHQREMHP